MKKLFLLLLVAIIAISAGAATTLTKSKVLKPYVWFDNYTGTTVDSLGVGQTTWNYEIRINKPDAVLYDVRIKVADKSTGSNGAAVIKLQGKRFSGDNYSDITTKTWYGGGADTTISITESSTKTLYRYLNVNVVRSAGTLKVDYLKTSLKK